MTAQAKDTTSAQGRIWLEHYPAGVPAEIDVHRFASLVDMIEQSCRRFATRPAFTHMGSVLTYTELDRLTRHFASALQRLDLQRGDRVAIMMPNLLQYPVAFFGILRAGMVVVNVNPLYSTRELQHQLADSGAAAIVVLENFAATLQAALDATALRHVITTQVGDLLPPLQACAVNLAAGWLPHRMRPWHLPGAISFPEALRRGRRQAPDELVITSDDVALLQYTGGTTGIPKGAVLTHGNLVANTEQISAWLGGTLEEGRETVVTPLPLHHIFALTANLLTFVRLGGNNVLVTDPRNVRSLLRTLRATRFSAISGVNTLFRLLLDLRGSDAVWRANAGALKVAVAGGMAVQRLVAQRWQQATGIPLTEGYGLTEAAPVVCVNPVEGVAFSGAIGMPLPSTRVAIRDEAGQDLPPGQAGEICVQGPQVMRGYWNMPQETARVLGADGWLRTGDLGVMDSRGSIRFLARGKEVIVVSGFKVYPGEVEDVAMQHPGIVDARAIGIPDAHSGEAVKLLVVRRDSALSAQAVLVHCRAQLASYKVPRHIEFWPALPRTDLGKASLRPSTDTQATAAGNA
ncbi:AMP-binding protein [Cupriavidus necator]|uniref:Long-chain-fatty-acid--CoA ligase n=1 Tax=Cupriavidus pinatubonensis (strain JMP 134 / LMG 1197) TaxID=264198 RepID=Q46MX6_CUPPJ|nr:AMP-binding protein [Cupriavidus necator]